MGYLNKEFFYYYTRERAIWFLSSKSLWYDISGTWVTLFPLYGIFILVHITER